MRKKSVPTESRAKRAPVPRYSFGILGGGNMATAILAGLTTSQLFPPEQILVSDVDRAKRRTLERTFGVNTTTDNLEVVSRCRTVVLAIKPQIVESVLAEIAAASSVRQCIISILAGVPTPRLEAGLINGARVIRAMPNTPALLGKGMTVTVRGRFATLADERLALRIFRAVGRAESISDEALMDAVTGLSGSGPAYVYLFAEALIRGGIEAGLSPQLSTKLALQTLTGAAAMLQEAGEPPKTLRERVSSPGGTTLVGLNEMARRGFLETVAAGVVAARDRSVEMGKG